MIEQVHLIDPSIFIQDQLVAVFQEKGIKILTSNSGTDALNLLAKTFPDIVIMEISLPDHKGITLLKSLRRALPRTRFIILASTLDKETLAEIIRVGIKDVFINPFCIENLLEKVVA